MKWKQMKCIGHSDFSTYSYWSKRTNPIGSYINAFTILLLGFVILATLSCRKASSTHEEGASEKDSDIVGVALCYWSYRCAEELQDTYTRETLDNCIYNYVVCSNIYSYWFTQSGNSACINAIDNTPCDEELLKQVEMSRICDPDRAENGEPCGIFVAECGYRLSCALDESSPDAGEICQPELNIGETCRRINDAGILSEQTVDCVEDAFCNEETGLCEKLRELNAPCRDLSECLSKRCSEEGFCIPQSGLGEACSIYSDCSWVMNCENGTCHAFPDEGEACADKALDGVVSDCRLDLICINGICRKPVCVNGQPGEPCRVSEACSTGLYCERGENTCQETAGKGDSCESRPCNDNLYCETDNHTCKESAGTGESCSERACREGLHCDENRICITQEAE